MNLAIPSSSFCFWTWTRPTPLLCLDIEGSAPPVPDGRLKLPKPLAILQDAPTPAQRGTSSQRPSQRTRVILGPPLSRRSSPRPSRRLAHGPRRPPLRLALLVDPATPYHPVQESGLPRRPAMVRGSSARRTCASQPPNLLHPCGRGSRARHPLPPRSGALLTTAAPVIVDVPKGWTSHAVTLRQLLEETLGMSTSAVAHFRSLQRYLHEQKLLFHTFAMTNERFLKVVIRGLPSTLTSKEILEAFQNDSFGVVEAKLMKTRGGLPTSLWLPEDFFTSIMTEQFGFRSGYSITLQLHRVLNHIIGAAERKLHSLRS
ncbi:hypothetical protein J6590_049078 [Homalodisca vitripennis]|nr:hypothetical protein J6590_049078 [Homalodisca vitripennis]